MLQGKFAQHIEELIIKRPFTLAIILGLLAMMISWVHFHKREGLVKDLEEGMSVLTANSDLRQGQRIDEQDIKIISMPRRYVQPNALRSISDLHGRSLMISIKEGAVVTDAVLGEPGKDASLSSLIPGGKRAVTVSIESDSVKLFPGDQVDIAVIIPNETDKIEGKIMPILKNITVLAVGDDVAGRAEKLETKEPSSLFGNISADMGKKKKTALSFVLSPTDGQKLLLAESAGALRVMLRPMLDADDDFESKTLKLGEVVR